MSWLPRKEYEKDVHQAELERRSSTYILVDSHGEATVRHGEALPPRREYQFRNWGLKRGRVRFVGHVDTTRLCPRGGAVHTSSYEKCEGCEFWQAGFLNRCVSNISSEEAESFQEEIKLLKERVYCRDYATSVIEI